MDVKVREAKPIDESNIQFAQDVIKGLNEEQKTLPCKYFYDETGSNLFEAICGLEEYYVTRTEIQLLKTVQSELAQLIGSNAIIIEPGAGAGIKIQNLLSALESPQTYVPIDISADFLYYSADKIKQKFPNINVLPIQGDFTQLFEWHGARQQTNRLVFFPGSTIGNFTPAQAETFLVNQKKLAGEKGALLIGFDLVKSPKVLEAAYNDRQGITAEFNKNLLARINNELGGNFDLDLFKHKAHFNIEQSRIEMHLISQAEQSVEIEESEFFFAKNESIHTENSYKYSNESFLRLASKVGLKSVKYWSDEKQLIAIHYLVPE